MTEPLDRTVLQVLEMATHPRLFLLLAIVVGNDLPGRLERVKPNVPGKVHGGLFKGGVGAVEPVPERQPPEARVEPVLHPRHPYPE